MDNATGTATAPEGTPTHVVTRPFEGSGGRQYKTGELVDASTWKHTERLVPRHLRPLEKPTTSLEQRIAQLEAMVLEQADLIAAFQPKARKSREVQDGSTT